jgi:hypothetical protein
MARAILVALAATRLLTGALPGQAAPATPAVLARQVFAAESSFAATMANRDSTAFADGWRALFVGRAPPFSWKPEAVEVLASGTLAHSSGPVHDAKRRQIGTFSSIWRREPDGTWLVVFDKGCPVCDCERGP